jgi:hypothetical protein
MKMRLLSLFGLLLIAVGASQFIIISQRYRLTRSQQMAVLDLIMEHMRCPEHTEDLRKIKKSLDPSGFAQCLEVGSIVSGGEPDGSDNEVTA